MSRMLIIDNYDSFTWNIYQYFCEIGIKVYVIQSDCINIKGIEKISPELLVISPGPGTPEDAGVSLDVVSYFANKIPILGICLGHQVIAQSFGAKIIPSRQVMHGKGSFINHLNKGVFTGLSQYLYVIRYHSLVVEKFSIPTCLEITAWSLLHNRYDEVMGIRHRTFAVEGIQFHPESILTEQGRAMLCNFIKNNKY